MFGVGRAGVPGRRLPVPRRAEGRRVWDEEGLEEVGEEARAGTSGREEGLAKRLRGRWVAREAGNEP